MAIDADRLKKYQEEESVGSFEHTRKVVRGIIADPPAPQVIKETIIERVPEEKKKKSAMKMMNFLIDEESKKRFETLCFATRVTTSEVIRDFIHEKINEGKELIDDIEKRKEDFWKKKK